MTLVAVEIDTFRAGDGVLQRYRDNRCSLQCFRRGVTLECL